MYGICIHVEFPMSHMTLLYTQKPDLDSLPCAGFLYIFLYIYMYIPEFVYIHCTRYLTVQEVGDMLPCTCTCIGACHRDLDIRAVSVSGRCVVGV